MIARLDIKDDWSGGLTLRQWWLPGDNHATMLGLTARFEPVVYDFGRVYADIAVGATIDEVCVGVRFRSGRRHRVEHSRRARPGDRPFLRYGQVVNPDSRVSNDGRAWAVGASFTYHFGRAAAGAKTETGPRRGGAYRLSVPDSDCDGVGDDEDVCKNVPQGKHPDPFKPGCPENDEDGDDVPDADDPCPVTAPGPTPDPKRPGCPLVDTDKDGIPDPDDACPLKPGPANADPAHNGCTLEKKRSAAPEEAAPPPDHNEPSTVKKRSRMK